MKIHPREGRTLTRPNLGHQAPCVEEDDLHNVRSYLFLIVAPNTVVSTPPQYTNIPHSQFSIGTTATQYHSHPGCLRPRGEKVRDRKIAPLCMLDIRISSVYLTPASASLGPASRPPHPPPHRLSCIRPPPEMGPNLQALLLFLKKLLSLFRQRLDQSTSGLWYIFAFLRSRLSPPHPKKKDDIRRDTEFLPTHPPTTVICASRMPPQLTPIAGGNTPVIASPTPIFRIRGATILDSEDLLHEPPEVYSNDHLGVDGSYLDGSGTISRLHSSPRHRDDHEYIHPIPPQNREDSTPNSPVMPPRPVSRPHSWHHPAYRPRSQPQHARPPSAYSFRSPSHLNGAEVAARGYLHAPPSPKPSSLAPTRPPSVAGSTYVYRAPTPTPRVRRPSPMRNMSQRTDRPPTLISIGQNVLEVPPDVPPLPQSQSRISVSVHLDTHSTVVNFERAENPEGGLRPMIGIDRYGKHRAVVVERQVYTYILAPVTTDFVR